MRCLVIGCGSIGTRRAKILAKMGHEVHGYDPNAVAAARATGGHAVAEVQLANFRPGIFDAAFICTPPDSGRPEQIRQCLELGVRGLFVEKPLALDASDVDEIHALGSAAFGRVTTMGACNLRFVGGVPGFLRMPKPWRLATFRMGQHRKFWSATHRPLSLIMDSIHELDLAVYLQGPIESVRGYSEEDAAEVSVHHEGGGLSHIMLDRLTDPPVREITVRRAGGDYESLRLQTNDGMYEREMAHFLDCVAKGTQTCNPLRQAAEVCARALEVAG